jgi:hypothetical protein
VGLPCLPASVRVESSCWAGESSLGPSTTRTGRRRSRACSSTGRAPRRRRARPERLATEVLLSHRRHGRLDRIQHEAERGRQQSRNRVLRSLWYYRVAYQFLFRRRRTALALGQRAAVHGNRQRPLRAGARLAPITTPAHSPESTAWRKTSFTPQAGPRRRGRAPRRRIRAPAARRLDRGLQHPGATTAPWDSGARRSTGRLYTACPHLSNEVGNRPRDESASQERMFYPPSAEGAKRRPARPGPALHAAALTLRNAPPAAALRAKLPRRS